MNRSFWHQITNSTVQKAHAWLTVSHRTGNKTYPNTCTCTQSLLYTHRRNLHGLNFLRSIETDLLCRVISKMVYWLFEWCVSVCRWSKEVTENRSLLCQLLKHKSCVSWFNTLYVCECVSQTLSYYSILWQSLKHINKKKQNVVLLCGSTLVHILQVSYAHATFL